MAEKEGRPQTTKEEKELMLQKLEPYLKSGLSVKKALLEAKIPSSTYYEIVNNDPEFLERINAFKQFLSIMVNSSIVNHLQSIVQKQNATPPVPLSKDDLEFMKWFATTSILTKDEYGERKNIGFTDPEEEIHKLASLIDEQVGKDGKDESSQ